ncbi:MAG: ABC-F family ATPase, partial [Acidobacteriota bacterium]|nr:ABC-F family ATPase [Acidobacteriota bacterium]
GLAKYEGTLIFVSHDRWFVSALATRIVEIKPEGFDDYRGTFEDYIAHCGDDHLDSDAVVLKARREKRKEKKARGTNDGDRKRQLRQLERDRDRLTGEIEQAEARVHEINETFCDPTFFEKTPPKQVNKLEREQKDLGVRVEELMKEWERVEAEIELLNG